MQYKTCKADEARTASYVGSTNNPYDADVEAVREDIRRNNRQVAATYKKHGTVWGAFMKIRVRPRGPRRPYSHDTLIKDALYFDIYKSEDTTRTYMLKYNRK
jgi:hypothetical protein|tara:strand:- start:2788 stop:3093 length:306 start_codon:yes stop_codon:yes gene_type:complete